VRRSSPDRSNTAYDPGCDPDGQIGDVAVELARMLREIAG
jgi:hypothetical protein